MTEKSHLKLSEALVAFYEKLFSWENSIAKQTELSPQQHHTIETIGSHGPIRMKPLAEQLRITMGTLTVMIDRLEKSGYVSRQKDPEDGRGFNTALTHKGRTIYKAHHACHLKLVEDISGVLNPVEFSVFLQALIKINQAI